jgi:hypothetical protein
MQLIKSNYFQHQTNNADQPTANLLVSEEGSCHEALLLPDDAE